jgi:hypothetical protein
MGIEFVTGGEKEMSVSHENYVSLPIRYSLTPAYVLSLLIALLLAAASAGGILYRDIVYPTEELLQGFLPNDVINLCIGLPILLVSMWLARRGYLIGLLFWPGALFYTLYNYIAYVFGMPFGVMFLPHITLVSLSVYTVIILMAGIDSTAVQQRLAGVVPERLAGGILAGLGILIVLRFAGMIVDALVRGTSIGTAEFATMIADFLVTPAWILGGVLLWRRRAMGYVAGAGLLFQTSMLFIGLIIFLILRPFLTGTPFAIVDVIVVSIMGSICFVPFGLFVRGVVTGRGSPPAG